MLIIKGSTVAVSDLDPYCIRFSYSESVYRIALLPLQWRQQYDNRVRTRGAIS